MTDTCGCGNPITPPDPDNQITIPAGWCLPAETLYAMPEIAECDDCKTRMLMMMEIGIDPGPNGEYLRFTRGGIKYERTD